MQLLELTLPTVAENLALDEALLAQAEAGQAPDDVLRLWESPQFAVVLGRASQVDVEANREACAADQVPIFRRSSGGAAVAIGPGCLMYAVVLSHRRHPQLAMISEAHALVMSRLLAALRPLLPEIAFQGTCDLTLHARKFSGNSLRCRREHVLYHGTLLYDFPLDRIARWLGTPPRQPDYREDRPHSQFVCNLPLPCSTLRSALAHAWNADQPLTAPPLDRVAALVKSPL
ncbi:MAG TPA: lipoate--protein ligase family protein [Pirellulaceae bacterium]|nr:lipoate--protein ligase family protein [Pirellulaceae bacterium]